MKKNRFIPTLIFLSLFVTTYTQAQFLEPEVVAAAGDQFENDQIGTLDWTMGEVMVEHFQSEDIILEQGFHHLDSIMIVSLQAISSGYELRISPNPTAHWLNIEAVDAPALQAILYDVSGKPVQKYQFRKIIQLDLSTLPAGLYLLRISDGVAIIQSYRIVKVDLN